jgi:hypothetical protein
VHIFVCLLISAAAYSFCILFSTSIELFVLICSTEYL